MGLMYNSATDKRLTYAELEHLPMPDHGQLGRFHQPYPFWDFVTHIHEALAGQNIQIISEEIAVTKDHERLFGLAEIAPMKGEYISAADWKLLMGFRGAHDQSISRGLCLGSSLIVCSNLCFHGNIGNIATKQTLYIADRIIQLIVDAVSMIPEAAGQLDRKFVAMKDHSLKPRIGDAALVEIFRQGGLSSSQLGKAVNEWHEPSYEEHTQYGWSAFRLLQACTEAVKPGGANSNPHTVAERTTISQDVILRDVMKYKEAA